MPPVDPPGHKERHLAEVWWMGGGGDEDGRMIAREENIGVNRAVNIDQERRRGSEATFNDSWQRK